MPLTLEQYAAYLDQQKTPWPAPPEVEQPRAKPHLVRLPGIRAVLWNVYGTLLAIPGGELLFTHPQTFIMDTALDKTVQEFKMWQSMSRKPGQPSEYLKQIYTELVASQSTLPISSSKAPAVASDRIWEAVLKKLLKNDYKFDARFFGSLNEFSRKVAYFFHSSMQGTACYQGAATALAHVAECGLAQGILADGQCFTMLQLQRGLAEQDPAANVEKLFDPKFCWLSYEIRLRKPSEKLFRQAQAALAEQSITSDQVLHIGSRVVQDLVPAHRLGMKTGLFAGDKASLQATAEQMKDPTSRPDVLLTELRQITEVVSRS